MKNLLAVVALLVYFGSNAQIKFEPGYIITSTGIKTECFVKNSGWRSTPESFDYRISESGETLKATTATTAVVSVSGITFKRFTVNMDRSSNELSSLSTSSEPVISRETVFLQLLVKGDANLYKYYDGVSLRYFYTTNDSEEPTALIYKMYRDDDTKILYNKTYKSTLKRLMTNKVNDVQLFKKLEYKDKDMLALFRKYNGITEEEAVDIPMPKGKLHLKIGTEIRMVSLSADYGSSATTAFDFDNKTTPAFGAELEWIMPFNRNKWGLFFAPYYHTYKNSGSKTFGSGASRVENQWEAKYNALELNLGGRYYMYLSGNAKIFVNGGYVFSKGFNDSGLNYTRQLDGNTTVTAKAITEQQSGLFAGAGFAYKGISGEIRYHGKHSINGKYGNWSSDYSGVGLLVQYSIL